MINIKRITVSGFKNLDRNTIEFSKITGLLSVNNYGKSNLLEAIEFGFNFIQENEKQKQHLMSQSNCVPKLISNYARNYFFEIEFELEIDNDIYNVIYQYEFEWIKSRYDSSNILSESLKIRKNNETQKHTLYIERNNNKGLYKSSLSGRCDKEIKIENNELIINKLKAYDNIFYLDIIKTINNLDFYIERHFDLHSLFEPSPIKNKENLLLYGDDNIARILYTFKVDYFNKYELIINSFKDLFPDIIDISIKEINLVNVNKEKPENIHFEDMDYMYILYVKNKYLNKEINFLQMSDGAKRILSILTYITLAEIKNIPLIGIEELENSIHPGLLKRYLDILNQLTSNTKIIITSHSPSLINYMDLNDLYIGNQTDDGSASFVKIKKTYFNRINEYASDFGVLVGEYLFDLMSSFNHDDINILKKYLNDNE